MVRSGRREPPITGARADRGTVTAETAVVLPGLLLILIAALWGVRGAAAHVACVDAARVGARAAARGEPLDAVRAAAASTGPSGARIEIRQGARFVHVTVVVEVRAAGGVLGGTPALSVEGRASALREDV